MKSHDLFDLSFVREPHKGDFISPPAGHPIYEVLGYYKTREMSPWSVLYRGQEDMFPMLHVRQVYPTRGIDNVMPVSQMSGWDLVPPDKRELVEKVKSAESEPAEYTEYKH